MHNNEFMYFNTLICWVYYIVSLKFNVFILFLGVIIMYILKLVNSYLNVIKYLFTENILKYYRIFDMYIPEKMRKNTDKKPLSISNAIDKIRLYLEIDKYAKEHKQIGKD